MPDLAYLSALAWPGRPTWCTLPCDARALWDGRTLLRLLQYTLELHQSHALRHTTESGPIIVRRIVKVSYYRFHPNRNSQSDR